jgi:hypothetical protein
METIILGLMILSLIFVISMDTLQKRRKFLDKGKQE